MTQLDITPSAQIRAHIAVLRGLYGDIAENLHDAEKCNDLWAQIATEQVQLAAIVQRMDAPV